MPTVAIPKFRLPGIRYNRRQRTTSAATTPLSSVGLNSSPSPAESSQQRRTNRLLWLTPNALLRTGPRLLFRTGPRLLLRAPVAVLRAPVVVRARFSTGRLRLRDQHKLFGDALDAEKVARDRKDGYDKSVGRQDGPNFQENQTGGPIGSEGPKAGPSQEKGSFTARLKQRLDDSPTKWYPIPLSLGIAVLVVVNFYKQKSWEQPETDRKGKKPVHENEIKVQGPWQVHVLGALPLRSMSRLYGLLNSYTLPVWFRVPGYKLYAFIFGVNLDECEPNDLREYRSMSEFFMRRLKEGVRPISAAQLVSPADGKVVNFGTVEGGRVEQVKGSTYSLDALLSGTGQTPTSPPPSKDGKPFHSHPQTTKYQAVDEKEFANINDIPYSLDELIGSDSTGQGGFVPGKSGDDLEKGGDGHVLTDASLNAQERSEQVDGPKRTVASDASVALSVAGAGSSTVDAQGKGKKSTVPKEGNQLFFAVVYLAPGDYHRFHSPTSWVVEKRRHFAGELFSVSPWMANKLQDLFVLNERVALLGRWRHGFFSMVPVGATNVGSIQVNFDSSLRTNSPLRPITPGTYSEATYAKASALLGGQPLQAGDEVGGFWLGSTIVLVFEAPKDFEFNLKMGQRIKVGEAMGDVHHHKK